MTKNIEKITGEIETLATELAELAKEGREAEIAPRLSEARTRWGEEDLRNRESADEIAAEYLERCRRLGEANMDLKGDWEIKNLVREFKTRGLTFAAAYEAAIGRFYDELDDDWNPVAIAHDHWRAHRVRLLAMEVYQSGRPAADKSEEERQREEMTNEEFIAIRKEAGLKIDPETAKVCCSHGYVVDPYGIYPDLTDEERCYGRMYFARSPDSDIWVCFRDLPDATVDALRQKETRGRASARQDVAQPPTTGPGPGSDRSTRNENRAPLDGDERWLSVRQSLFED